MTWPEASEVPVDLRTGHVRLRPILVTDAEQDYAAVMDTREELRLWEQSTWPADDFTLEENRADLADMEERHRAGRAYSYTVLDPDGSECRGCVYIFPTSATFLTRATVTALGAEAWDAVDAVVYFWVRRTNADAALDEHLLATLRAWFAGQWGFGDVVFVTGEGYTRQVELFAREGMSRRFEIREPDKNGKALVFG